LAARILHRWPAVFQRPAMHAGLGIRRAPRP